MGNDTAFSGRERSSALMLGAILQPEIQQMIRDQAWTELRAALDALPDPDVADLILDLPPEEEGIVFRLLPKERAAQVFSYLPIDHQEGLIASISSEQTRDLVAGMSPDDRAALLEELPPEVTRRLMDALGPEDLRKTREIMGFPPESAGRIMTPDYVRLRPEMTVAEAIEAIRRSPRTTETLDVVYVIDSGGRLVRDLRLATIVRAEPQMRLADLKDRPLVTVRPCDDREQVARVFRRYDRVALPVVSEDGRMLGIVTVDDVLDVIESEATEDIHRIGGLEAIDTPYATTPFLTLLKKRGTWLSALFLGEMLTATAMGYFEHEIARAVVLALFVPLIISSGGNSGSQAATLIVRAMALSEIRLRDWWRVMRREIASGLTLGTWLGVIGFLRVVLWQQFGWVNYTDHYLLVALTVWLSLIGVVAFGTVSGSMLPFILRRVGLDPATSSAPFVATLVDVTGLVIYFGIAAVVLSGTLL